MSTKKEKTSPGRSTLNVKPIFVVNRIVAKITGLNQAMLHRAKLLSEYSGQRVSIVCFYYDPRHYSTLQAKLLSEEKINDRVDIINMYEYFKGEDASTVQAAAAPNYDDYFIEKKRNALRYFLHGNYIKYEKYSEDGLLERADYFNESRYCHKSEEYDDKSNIARVQYKDLVSGQTRNEVHHRSDGTIFMTKWYEQNYDAKTNHLIRINIFDKNGSIKKIVYSEEQLKHYFLDCIVGEQESIVLAEARSIDRLIVNYKNSKAHRVAIIHTTHLESPSNPSSEINTAHKVMLSNLEEFDAVVTLTTKQRQDLEHKIGKQSKLHVIPHANRARPNINPSGKGDRIVIVARLAKQKQIDHSIKAMESVVKELPNATLCIFGDGADKNNLAQLIHDLHLDKHVFLKGFSNNPIAEYSQASLSLFTSEYEGFGLVVLESLSQGCPVISYDIPYGPSDMITDGKNGYLVEKDNIGMLSKKIIEALSDKKKLQQLSKEATKSVEKFDEKSFVEKWTKLFNDTQNNKQAKKQ
ncbi:MAG: glycosyltransferase [Candidatus Saccharimonadales bacterium]